MSDAPDMPDTPEDVPDMLDVSEGSEDPGALLNSIVKSVIFAKEDQLYCRVLTPPS